MYMSSFAWILGLTAPIWIFILEFCLINRKASKKEIGWLQAHTWYVGLGWLHFICWIIGIFWYFTSPVMAGNFFLTWFQVAFFFTAWLSALIALINTEYIRYSKLDLIEKQN